MARGLGFTGQTHQRWTLSQELAKPMAVTVEDLAGRSPGSGAGHTGAQGNARPERAGQTSAGGAVRPELSFQDTQTSNCLSLERRNQGLDPVLNLGQR